MATRPIAQGARMLRRGRAENFFGPSCWPFEQLHLAGERHLWLPRGGAPMIRYLKLVAALCLPLLLSGQIGPPPLLFPLAVFGASGGISTPTSLGSTIQTRNGLTTVALTTTAAIPAAAAVIVAAGNVTGTAVTVSSISDGTNTYTKAGGGAATASTDAEIWYKTNASAVGSGATITVTFSGALDTNAAYVAAFYVTSLSAVDKAPAVSSTTSISTGTLAQATELIVGTMCGFLNASSPTYNEASGFTNLASLNIAAGNHVSAGLGYQLVSSTNSVTYNPTWTNAANQQSTDVVSFKGP